MSVSKNTVDSAPAPNPQASIQQERAQARFNPTVMHYFLESSKEHAEVFKTLIQQLERDPILGNDASYYDLTKAQQREITARRIGRVAQYLEVGDPLLWETTRTSLL
ncbi:hypothetical protein OXX80_013542, partial [Metschnikowia pulcherrima]